MGRRTEERKGERRAKTKGNQRERGDITVDGIGYSLKNLYPKLFNSTNVSSSWEYVSLVSILIRIMSENARHSVLSSGSWKCDGVYHSRSDKCKRIPI